MNFLFIHNLLHTMNLELLQRNLQINTYSNSREDHTTFEDYNPGQNSGDTKAIAYQIEASSLPPSPLGQC